MLKQPYMSSLIVVIRRTSRGSRCSGAAWCPTKSRSLPCNGRVLFHRFIYAVRGGYHRYSVETWCTECAYLFRLLEAMEVTRRRNESTGTAGPTRVPIFPTQRGCNLPRGWIALIPFHAIQLHASGHHVERMPGMVAVRAGTRTCDHVSRM